MTNITSDIEFFKQVFGGAWITQGLWVAAELGIADLLAQKPQTASELASRTHAHGGALYRVLRALASAGVFMEDAQGRFSLTPRANLLRSDVAGSQHAVAAMMGAEFHETWGALLHSAQTGEPGFKHRYGTSFFKYMEKHPDRHAIYDAAMTGIHSAETEPMIAAYRFDAFRLVVDVGGGNGLTLATILNRYPAVQGTLFDLPTVVERACPNLSTPGLSGRSRIVGGDFFSSVPAGADAYLMRHIIHDWEDGEATTILHNCRNAMNPNGKVLVVETVIPAGNEPCFGKWLDLMMMLVGGRERTEEEYKRLFAASGLRLNRIIPTSAGVSIIEGVRA